MLQTPAQSIIEFTAHVIKLFSQIRVAFNMNRQTLVHFVCEFMTLQTPYVAATSFCLHRTEIFDFVVRWDKKVYRRQQGEGVEKKHNDG